MAGYKVKVDSLQDNCEYCVLRNFGCVDSKRRGYFEFINSNIDAEGLIDTSNIMPKVLKKSVKLLRTKYANFTKID